MKIRLTQTKIAALGTPNKPYWITDEIASNLRLYVGTTGAKVWYVSYRVKGDTKKQSHKIGPASDALTVAMARDLVKQFEARLSQGEDPKAEAAKAASRRTTLGDFLTDAYEPWVVGHRKSGNETMQMLRTTFGSFFNRNIEDLALIEMEKWRNARLKSDSKTSTINRLMGALKSALNWGVKHNLFDPPPLLRLEPLQEHDSDEMVRYLSDDERARLMVALDAREKKMREGRESHNRWLEERGKKLMPELVGEYADHLKPMVLLSLHTGIRQNNLFSLLWGDIDFASQTMTLRAAVSKSGKTLRFPINSVAVSVLSSWREQSTSVASDALVFPSPQTGKKFNTIARSWRNLMRDAKIENFRWHDMRHDFASQLVMHGIDLNTVRELMGHASLAMTLRYAHLAPKNKLRAAEVLAEI